MGFKDIIAIVFIIVVSAFVWACIDVIKYIIIDLIKYIIKSRSKK